MLQRLEVKQIAKRYGLKQVLKDVSLTLGRGEVVGLLGSNGAGKTTCFYSVVGLVSVDEGQIWVNQIDITDLSMDQRASMGISYLPQEASIFRKLSVEDNIRAILELQKDASGNKMIRETIEQRTKSLMHDLQITHIAKSLGSSLSGGERRRVEIARALALDPDFILFDEPFAGVDPIAVIEIQRIIRFLKLREIGVLITDHNVRETLSICDRAYIIHDGRVLVSGNPNEIIENKEVRRVYLGENFYF